MSGVNGRNKGAAFERQIAGMLRDQLGIDCKRNLMQTAEGGHDLIGLPGFAIECKRYAVISHGKLDKFWAQCVSQAQRVDLTPCLIVKGDRQPVRVFIPWSGLGWDAYQWDNFNCAAEISFELFCAIVREGLTK